MRQHRSLGVDMTRQFAPIQNSLVQHATDRAERHDARTATTCNSVRSTAPLLADSLSTRRIRLLGRQRFILAVVVDQPRWRARCPRAARCSLSRLPLATRAVGSATDARPSCACPDPFPLTIRPMNRLSAAPTRLQVPLPPSLASSGRVVRTSQPPRLAAVPARSAALRARTTPIRCSSGCTAPAATNAS